MPLRWKADSSNKGHGPVNRSSEFCNKLSG